MSNTTKTFVPEYMKKWKLSGWDNNYAGEDLSEWYILIARTRDSDILENSNFESIKRDLIAEGFEITGDVEELTCVLLAEFGHWACGWIESLMIHQSNIKALEWADEVKEALDDYLIYDEQDYYERESNLIWESVREYYVEDYLRENNLEYDDKMLDYLTKELIQNIEFDVDSSDNVICPFYELSNMGDLLEKLTEEYIHLKTCPTCHITFNPDKTACNCQMRLFMENK